jgi:hypothetical protein
MARQPAVRDGSLSSLIRAPEIRSRMTRNQKMTTPLQNFDLYDEPSSTAADVYVTCQHGDAQCTCASTEPEAVDSFADEQLIKALTLCYWSGRKDATDIERRYDTEDERARRTEVIVDAARTVALARREQ